MATQSDVAPPKSGPSDATAEKAGQWTVSEEQEGWRIDRALAALVEEISRSQARALIEEGKVLLDDERVTNPRNQVVAGQVLAASYSMPTANDELVPQSMKLDIVDEDDDILVINKPPGLVVHPGNGVRDGTLANGLAAYSSDCAALPRGGIVHRLDKDTSGLLLVSKTSKARLQLLEMFKLRSVKRSYLAIVHGKPNPTGMIDRAIGRDRSNRLKMAVTEAGRPAITRWRVLRSSKAYSLVTCQLESGRTHQIRVHMERLGHPVAGDSMYRRHARSEGNRFSRQMLHAYQLEFEHPVNGEEKSYVCEPPADFSAAQQEYDLVHDTN